jgi:hypothetical protein
VYVIISGIFLIVPVVAVVISVIFIRGIGQQNPSKFIAFLILLGLEAFGSLFMSMHELSMSWFLHALVVSYYFVCVYSLYLQFKYPAFDPEKGHVGGGHGDASYQTLTAQPLPANAYPQLPQQAVQGYFPAPPGYPQSGYEQADGGQYMEKQGFH